MSQSHIDSTAADEPRAVTSILQEKDNGGVELPLDEQNREQLQLNDLVSNHGMFSISFMTVALMSAVFLVALDVNILATAIPRITTEFHSIDDVSWYGIAYSLPKMALQPTYGRIYGSFSYKHVFCCTIVIFSLVCHPLLLLIHCAQRAEAREQRSEAPGYFVHANFIAGFHLPRSKLPIYLALLSSMFMVASCIGPVIGGVFASSSLTWRFCFWINIPIGAVSIIITAFAFPTPARAATKLPLREKLGSLDPLGTSLLIGSVSSLVLALQWRSGQLPWGDSRMRRKERALIPLRFLTQRSIAVGSIATACYMMAMNTLTYYLPFYFQASKDLSPRMSGIYILALAVPEGLAGVTSGIAVTMTGMYVPFMMVSGIILAVGSGLLTTLEPGSGLGQIIGYQIVASIGFGLGIQLPLTAMRNVLDEKDIPIANALVVFSQGLGTSLSLSIAQTIFINSLSSRLETQLSTAEAKRIITLGAAKVNGNYLPLELVPFIAAAYSYAVRCTFYLAVAAAGVVAIGNCMMERKRLERAHKEQGQDV
ncbi:related to aflatoxin efflux pump AFLT [Phialocephala subalpina]|uniref:Related to aflatoxin efflux pump AFLT n=1 Tax=Phialocephala subalpina TaxID=576137 RepID=A0A1L7XMY8_9HELO|nr:related to aflatoxin efflux pump AFLT [Phialocephala subalpina]